MFEILFGDFTKHEYSQMSLQVPRREEIFCVRLNIVYYNNNIIYYNIEILALLISACIRNKYRNIFSKFSFINMNFIK